MKGVLFNIVEHVVEETLPGDTWDLALDRARVTGAYTSLGDYPDTDLLSIVDALSDRTDLSVADVLRHAGRHGFPHLVDRHGDLLEGIDGMGPLLHRLDSVIHPEVLKLYPDARPPSFAVEDREGGFTIRYRSDRGLCHLAEGLLLGAADHFDATVEVHQSTCRHRGDRECVLEVETQGAG